MNDAVAGLNLTRLAEIMLLHSCNVTPRPVNQKAVQGDEAGRRITNGSARQRRRRGEMYSDSARRVAEEIMMSL